MKLCCVDSLVPGNTYLEKAECLHYLGYDGMAVYADCERWTDEDTYQLQSVHEKTGVEIAEFCLVGKWYGHLTETSARAELGMQTIRRALEISASVGAVTEVEFDIPRTSEISYDFHEYPLPPSEAEYAFVVLMQQLCDYAAELGTGVLIEACNRYEREYNNLQAHSLQLIQKIDRPNAALLCDIFHMMLDEHDILQTLRSCAGYVRHVHLGDTNRRLPGQGMLPWNRIFGVLHEIGYTGYLNLECSVFGDAEQQLREANHFLRQYM